MEFESLAGIIALNEGDYFNFQQFGYGISSILGIMGRG